MSAEGIVHKQAKGNGWVVAKFISGGFFKLNTAGAAIGANSAGETVDALHLIRATGTIGNGASWKIARGANTILILTGEFDFDLSDGLKVDAMGGEPQANVIVTKVGASPSSLILKFHKQVSITGGSLY